MKTNIKLIFTVIFIQIISTIALFNIWNEELQDDDSKKIFFLITIGIMALSVILSIVFSLIKTKKKALNENDSMIITIILLAWVPITGIVYKVFLNNDSMNTWFVLYIILYLIVIIGCFFNYIKQKK